MINYLSKAVFTTLTGLYGTENVFTGSRMDGDIPFVHYNIQAAANEIEHAGTNGDRGTIFAVTVAFSTYSTTYAQAANRIDEIATSFLTGYPTLQSGKVHSIHSISQEVSEEDDREQNGESVYRGILILEVSVQHG